jgi:FAD/FMN-containing dehydrogenase
MEFDGNEIAGRVLWRGRPGYEEARRSAVWHSRKPARYPDGVLIAETERDVVDAVKLAGERGMRVKARAGGHSWTASSVREDGLLLDLSRLTDFSIDAGTATASVQPGAKGRDFNRALAEHGLFFPTGHCPTIAIGGFLLQGGWGWLSRDLGPACMSVVAVDVVMATGEIVHADAEHNQELLWAARGAGSGYFGVVVRYHLRCHPRPTVLRMSTYVYPRTSIEAVTRWVQEQHDAWPAGLELQLLATGARDATGEPIEGGEPILMLLAFALFSDEDAAAKALTLLDACPERESALIAQVAVNVTLDQLYDVFDDVARPEDASAGDSLWSDAGPDELVPAFVHMVDELPTPRSYVLCWPWIPRPLEGSALTITGRHYVSPFAVWTDPADEPLYDRWAADQVRAVDHLSKGIQLADENLIARPNARYMSDEHAARLEELRARWDPEGRFHGFLFGPITAGS